MKVRLTLVSASPRRQELLAKLQIPFDILPSNAHERWVGDSVTEIAKLNAVRKVKASELYGKSGNLLLGADTVIEFDGRVYGKPSGIHAANRMLELFAGNTHRVITGICLAVFTRTGRANKTVTDAAVSEVVFHDLTKKDIRHYLRSGEWQGKAGAYAIQGEGGKFVSAVRGDYENVVGLPLGLLREKLGSDFSDCNLL
ncbi:MAG: septum formation protein Maf [Calditrichaeota bacterium]|nr:septum formation protein Maf [Calditrichota bacterium]MCB9368274.1 septum formation protein Maf [Calditrichota bacterium]